MSKISVKMIGTGNEGDAFRVNLPTYIMIGEPDYVTKTVLAEVPDDELTKAKDRPDGHKLREKYRGQPAWDRADVATDV